MKLGFVKKNFIAIQNYIYCGLFHSYDTIVAQWIRIRGSKLDPEPDPDPPKILDPHISKEFTAAEVSYIAYNNSIKIITK